ncbi:hypothetical protein ACMGDH_01080 [Sphingomonas sp. DT-207]|uniref:hypothetical protein n=1 Tax=Sphingomonas sp. DT-207 TaxID=3396167 RepID=UPI003F19C940
MIRCNSARIRQALLSVCAAAVVTTGIASTEASAQSRRQQRDDARTCADFGNRYGTPAYSKCMLDQQRRRDFKERDTLEEMALTSQIARDGQIMAERARRQRCERNPDRRECGR